MKPMSIVCNIGHFDSEIQISALSNYQWTEVKPGTDLVRFPDGKQIIVLAKGRLVNLAWRFCRDRSLAEDMAQEAFVKAFRSLKAFRGDSSFGTWLTAIALNTYRTALRAREPIAVPLDPERAAVATESSWAPVLGSESIAEM